MPRAFLGDEEILSPAVKEFSWAVARRAPFRIGRTVADASLKERERDKRATVAFDV